MTAFCTVIFLKAHSTQHTSTLLLNASWRACSPSPPLIQWLLWIIAEFTSTLTSSSSSNLGVCAANTFHLTHPITTRSSYSSPPWSITFVVMAHMYASQWLSWMTLKFSPPSVKHCIKLLRWTPLGGLGTAAMCNLVLSCSVIFSNVPLMCYISTVIVTICSCLLQNSLGGCTKKYIIVTISPHSPTLFYCLCLVWLDVNK